MSPQVSPAPSPRERTLREELRAIERQYRTWHCWLSDEGWCYAVTSHYHYANGSGFTVSASHVGQLGRAIAKAEHDLALVAA